MKKLLFILLLFFSVNSVKAGDTVKVKVTKFSIKPEIGRTLSNATISECYDTLARYCSSSVSLIVDFDGDTRTEQVTDSKLIDELNDFIKQVPYTYIKVLFGKNRLDKETFVIELYWSNSNEQPPLVQMYFVLNDKEEICTVVIITD